MENLGSKLSFFRWMCLDSWQTLHKTPGKIQPQWFNASVPSQNLQQTSSIHSWLIVPKPINTCWPVGICIYIYIHTSICLCGCVFTYAWIITDTTYKCHKTNCLPLQPLPIITFHYDVHVIEPKPVPTCPTSPHFFFWRRWFGDRAAAKQSKHGMPVTVRKGVC